MNKKRAPVDDYIARCPKEVRGKLKELRALIRKLVPNAKERISYGMPFYDYKGRLVYFASANGYIGLYIPSPIIAEHTTELKAYVTTKSAIHLPIKKFPVTLIKKLIKARMKYNESNKIAPIK